MTATLGRITGEDADKAYEEWGCNCGPGAVAAIMGLTLDEVRPHMGDFEKKRYTNPTLMWQVLDSIGRPWRKIGREWPRFGLVRIQFEGPWTEPGANPRWAYRQTHWIASVIDAERGHGIFDINMTGNGTGWGLRTHWETIIVPLLVESIPRADGGWHITHGVEIN